MLELEPLDPAYPAALTHHPNPPASPSTPAVDKVTRRKVAIKKISDTFHDLIDAKRILREIKLLRHFNSHENVITIQDMMCLPADTVNFSDVYIVTNLMESDLDRIIASNQTLTDQHFKYFLYQILRGLKYIHSADVLHRDLKPSNLLVNANCDLALCDFGLSRGVDGSADAGMLTEYVVTRWYRAPELLCDSSSYGKAVDIWSVGCIFAEMLCRKPFFRGDHPHHQLQVIVDKLGCPAPEDMEFVTNNMARKAILSAKGAKGQPLSEYLPSNTSSQAVDLLQKMLVFCPDGRITVEMALEHKYLRELHSQMEEPVCSSNFDSGFEKNGYRIGQTIPKEHLQDMMFQEMLQLRPIGEESMESMEFSSDNLDLGLGGDGDNNCRREAEAKNGDEEGKTAIYDDDRDMKL